MHKFLSSVQNPFVKNVALLLEKSRVRRKQQRFVIEGQREIMLAIRGGYSIETLLYFSDLFTSEQRAALTQDVGDADWIEVNREVYEKLAYRGSTEGLMAIAKVKDQGLDQLPLSKKDPLILVAEAPEKPGNIGALLRTADAANLDAVIIANPRTDLFNPNIIRSSVGCVFTNTIATGTTEEIIDFLKKKDIQIYCAALQASTNYAACDFTKATAIVVGTEADGLSDTWLSHSDQNIIIPMAGAIDSMNVSVAAGILIFEAKRQRGFM